MADLVADKQKENDARESHPKKPVKLAAEKIFNFGVYGVLNYGIQVTTAVLATEWIKHGGGKAYFQKAAEWAGKNIIPKVTNKTGAAAVKEANTYLVGTTLIMMGNAFLIPVKWFENHKAHFVRKIDERIIRKQESNGYYLTPEEKQRREEAHEAIAKELHPTWPTLLTARVAGLSSFYLTSWLIGESRNKWMQEKVADGVQHVLKNSGVDSLKKLGHSPRIRNFSEIAFVDFFYSIAVANTVFHVTQYLTNKQRRKKAEAAHKEAAPVEASAEESTPTTSETKETTSFSERHARKPVEKPAPHSNFTDYVHGMDTAQPQVAL